MKVKNPVSQNIRIFSKINQKKIGKTKKFKFFKVCTYMYALNAHLAHAPASVTCGMRSACGTIEPSAPTHCLSSSS